MTPYYQDASVTIYHGDSLEILPTLSGVGAVVTDPPYSSGGAFRGDRTLSTVAKYVNSDTLAYRHDFAGDSRDQRSFLAWAMLWLNAARNASVPGAVLASFIDWRQLPTLSEAVQAGGWTWRGVAVWDKGYGRPREGGFSNAAEYVLWGSNGPFESHDAYPPGIFRESIVKDRDHIAQKPLDVMKWILGIAKPGALVLDPFMGSGTTLEAAKAVGMRSIGIEVDERYCEVAAQRCSQEVLGLLA
jgi:site-specific DNA-methyltransferase (adenine-specific)